MNNKKEIENTQDYNFFYMKESDNTIPLKIIITSSIGEGKYTKEDISKEIEKITIKNTQGKIELYQDDGEQFWNISSNAVKTLDIGTKEDNYAKWEEIKEKIFPIAVEDILVLCQTKNSKESQNNMKMK